MPTYNIAVIRLYTIDAKSRDKAEQFALEERCEDEDGEYSISADHSEIMSCEKV